MRSQQQHDGTVTTIPETSTVGRVAAVLTTLGAEDHAELPVSEIARRLGRERSQISRMLKSLAATGLVEQNPDTRAYRLGWQLHVLATKAGDQRLLNAGPPILRNLVAATKETALLSVLQGNRSFSILRERSPHSLQSGGWIGRTSPLHVTASGRTLLLDRTDEEVRDLTTGDFAADQYGPNALTSLPELLTRLRHEREANLAIATEELETGLVAISAPVRDETGRIIAAVNISGPTNRVLPRMKPLTAATKAAAHQLSTLPHRNR